MPPERVRMRPLMPSSDRAAPSLLRYAPAFVLLAIAIADAGRVADTDLWGHIAFGRLFLTAGPVSHDPFNQPFYLILNLAVGGMFDDNVEPPRPMSPQRMLVDYVRVYQCCK